MITPFQAMQSAVDIVLNSEHDKNKIAACIFDKTTKISRCNHRSDELKNSFLPEIRIGSSSQFIHAEVACIFDFPKGTNDCEICITDPMCPNCAKAIASSGIKHVYIDHKGMEKDFVVRRGDDFKEISLKILENAGVFVSVIYRKEQKIEPFIQPLKNHINNNDIEEIKDISTPNKILLNQFINSKTDRSFAFANVKTDNGNKIIYVPELKYEINEGDYKSHKYRNFITPINRLLFTVKKNNYSINNNEITCNLHPSSRDLVNVIGAKINNVIIANNTIDHDKDGLIAGDLLQKNGIITLNTV